jgi:hypothetical protein
VDGETLFDKSLQKIDHAHGRSGPSSIVIDEQDCLVHIFTSLFQIDSSTLMSLSNDVDFCRNIQGAIKHGKFCPTSGLSSDETA